MTNLFVSSVSYHIYTCENNQYIVKVAYCKLLWSHIKFMIGRGNVLLMSCTDDDHEKCKNKTATFCTVCLEPTKKNNSSDTLNNCIVNASCETTRYVTYCPQMMHFML